MQLQWKLLLKKGILNSNLIYCFILKHLISQASQQLFSKWSEKKKRNSKDCNLCCHKSNVLHFLLVHVLFYIPFGPMCPLAGPVMD